ncbi:MAG: hypothetical protein MRJ92_16610 [Nitrospira sp.]|nr:hypothetical protein [Nitrospira sp.]
MMKKARSGDFLDQVYFKSSQRMSEVPTASVDLIVTSPPYFNVKDYSLDGRQSKRHSARSKGQL